jgi:uncharacterized membrane protein
VPGPLPGAQGERRWPAATAIAISLVLPLLLISEFSGFARIALSAVGFVLLVAVIATDPGRIDQRSRRTRGLSIGLVLVLGASASISTVRLIAELLDGAPELQDPTTLLAAGALIWLENALVFSVFFWEVDGGGPAGRFHRVQPHPDFAFPQQMNPDLAPELWRPEYHDYLYLALTNALAFSPTDAMPMTPVAKLSMALQSLLSIVILSLVVANAVNILGSTG